MLWVEPCIAVAADRTIRGVKLPDEYTYDFRAPPGSVQNTRGITCDFEVLELEQGLRRRYWTDAHLAQYIVFDEDGLPLIKQPRVNRDSIPWFYSQGYQIKLCVLFGDWDNYGHKKWTLELYQESLEKWRTIQWLKNVGGHYSMRGQRVIQVMSEFIPFLGADYVIRRWVDEGIQAGVPLDLKCRDATHLFRLPKVLRDGEPQNYEPDLDSMVARDLSAWVRIPRMEPAYFEQFGERGKRAILQDAERFGWGDNELISVRRRVLRPMGTIVRQLPQTWIDRCAVVANACAVVPYGERHDFYLHLSGGLCHHGVPLEFIPAIIHQIADLAGHQGDHHAITARDTAVRFASGAAVTGFQRMQALYPEAAAELEKLGLKPSAKRIEAQQEEAAREAAKNPPTPLETVRHELRQAIRFPDMGITMIAGGCGIGKSHITNEIAQERYLDHKPTDPTKRMPADGKTVVSCDKHILAQQTMRQLQAIDVPVQRLHGPASLRRADGTHVCIYHEAVSAFSGAGLSPEKYLCSQCECREGCPARRGSEGIENAPVTITVHSLLGQAVVKAGKHALTVIDEPPSPVRNVLLTEDDLNAALSCLGSFEKRYADGQRPLIRAILAWLQKDPFDNSEYTIIELAHVLTSFVVYDEIVCARAATGVSDTGNAGPEALDCTRFALPETSTSSSVPLRLSEGYMARKLTKRARLLGRAARTLRTLFECAQGVTAASKPIVRGELSKEGPGLRLVYPNHEYRLCLQRQTTTVMLDANAKLHVAAIKAVIGREPVVKEFIAKDGAPIYRTVLPIATATRGMWAPHTHPILGNGFLSILQWVFQWLKQQSESICDVFLVSYTSFSTLIRMAQGGEVSTIAREKWVSMGLDPATIPSLLDQIRPILASWKGTIRVGHFGGVKGLNEAARCHAVVTLGDPRPNLDTVQQESRYLQLEAEDHVVLAAKADLDQCHGRLRAVQRTEPGWMLHVGQILPGGYGWDQATVLPVSVMDSMLVPPMTNEEFNFIYASLQLTREDLAFTLGIKEQTLARYSRMIAIPRGIALVLRRMYAENQSRK